MGILKNLYLRLVKGALLTNQEVDDNFSGLDTTLLNVAADFYGATDPATDATSKNVVVAGMTWADTGTGAFKRRSNDGMSWIVEYTLFKQALPQYAEADIPASDIGPIYVAGKGAMEWTGLAYTPIGGGAKGGMGNQVFYENDLEVTADYEITSGKNAGTFGPVTIDDGVTVTIPDGSTWSIV